MHGDITYNGSGLHEFVPQRTASYVSQVDDHIGEMTVRETFDFSVRPAADIKFIISSMHLSQYQLCMRYCCTTLSLLPAGAC